MVKKVFLVVGLIFVMFALVGCNTIQGLGKDIQAFGKGLSTLGGAEVRLEEE